ncbi:preprotein translocase subunit YajC [Natroniella acetigena]|uniref:preprotein translocase subunit YajC n=1 Tax=Natroniella acetigena TaxID=52004 RepID=UPI00200B8737|nr:preprotein translocase subunit YajC [Natroniella acetigena]MCK8827553.1 preprotein translocase subunit YajC [Natroniella acetigena]
MEFLLSLVPWVVIFAVFWFLFIRPQKKKQQEHQEMLSKLDIGDQVVTIGGIKGLITAIDEEDLKLEIAPEVEIEISRRAIGRMNSENTGSIEN